MENDGKIMTGEESLTIITEMINKTKVNIAQSSFHLLFWGWLILGCSLSEILLWKFTDFASPWYVWFFTIPGVFVSFIYGFTKGRKATVHTYAEMLYAYTWLAFFFATVILFIIHAKDVESIGKYILLLAGMPAFISGCILRFRPLILGGIAFWVFALIAHFGGGMIAAVSIPAAMLTGYLIPGYMLKWKSSHDTI